MWFTFGQWTNLRESIQKKREPCGRHCLPKRVPRRVLTEIAHVLPCRIVNGTCTEKHMRSDEKSSYLTGTKVMRHMCVISTRTILVRDADSIEFLTLGSEAFPASRYQFFESSHPIKQQRFSDYLWWRYRLLFNSTTVRTWAILTTFYTGWHSGDFNAGSERKLFCVAPPGAALDRDCTGGAPVLPPDLCIFADTNNSYKYRHDFRAGQCWQCWQWRFGARIDRYRNQSGTYCSV